MLLAGCGSSDDGTTSSTTPQPPSDGTPDSGSAAGTVLAPGLYDIGGGRSQAVGVLSYQDLEGGFWAVVDSLPGESAAGPTVMAVLVGAEDLDVDLESLAGRYVTAEGVPAGDVSIRMAGPELKVDSIGLLEDGPAGTPAS